MAAALFRHRLGVIAFAFLLAIGLAWLERRSGVASTAELTSMNAAFLLSTPFLLLAFLLRTFGEAHLGAVYSQEVSATLVSRGPHRAMRHPLYLGVFLFFVGVMLPYLSPLSLLVLATMHGVSLRAIALYEEGTLAQRHGPAWQAYAAQVPRLGVVPRPLAATSPPPPIAAFGWAALSNLAFLALLLYRVSVITIGATRLAGWLTLASLIVWLVVLFSRRLKQR
jgi:protein-S-isoprenylcysteine O-methyltransferase Ste14